MIAPTPTNVANAMTEAPMTGAAALSFIWTSSMTLLAQFAASLDEANALCVSRADRLHIGVTLDETPETPAHPKASNRLLFLSASSRRTLRCARLRQQHRYARGSPSSLRPWRAVQRGSTPAKGHRRRSA